MKIAIPLVVVLAVGALVYIGLFDPFRKIPKGLTVGSYGLDGTKVTMDSPKLSGFHKDGKPYQVWAKSASQDITKQNIVELLDMQGTMGLTEGGKAHISAATATYDTSKNTILMRKDVQIHSDSGYDLTMNEAFVDFQKNSMISNDKVTMQLKNGTVLADSMHVTDDGKTIVFEGHVQSTFKADFNKSDAGGDAPSKGTAQ